MLRVCASHCYQHCAVGYDEDTISEPSYYTGAVLPILYCGVFVAKTMYRLTDVRSGGGQRICRWRNTFSLSCSLIFFRVV